MNTEVIVNAIKKLCKKNNITVSQLEKEIGLSQGLVSKWMNTTPSLDKISDIADYFQVSLDEVVGRKYVVDDNFIVALIEATDKQNIIWHKYNSEINVVKKYQGTFIDPDDFMNYEQYNNYVDSHDEISYYASFKNGYISIYSFCRKFEITTPKNILLFIQPSIDAELVPQKYATKELLPLWLKIIYTLGEEQPDEIKAEELKTQFVLNDSKTNSKHGLSKNTNMSDVQKLLSNPDIIKLMEVYSQPEFQQLQKTFSNPEFQAAIQVANKLQHYFDKKD